MTWFAALLLALSALLHATWNLVGKRQLPSVSFFIFTDIGGIAMISPLLVLNFHKFSQVPPQVFGFALTAGFFLALYMFGLSAAYRVGHLSHIYPLTRSFAAVLVAVISFTIGGEGVGWLALTGLGLVVVGCFFLPMRHMRDLSASHYLTPAMIFAVITSIAIAGYTVVDSTALGILRSPEGGNFSPMGATLVYWPLESLCSISWLLVFKLFGGQTERKRMKRLTGGGWKVALPTGMVIYMAYGLTLLSMSYVSDVTYVGAFRQMSVPLGALLGIVILKEPRPAPKIWGVALAFAGLVLVGFG